MTRLTEKQAKYRIRRMQGGRTQQEFASFFGFRHRQQLMGIIAGGNPISRSMLVILGWKCEKLVSFGGGFKKTILRYYWVP